MPRNALSDEILRLLEKAAEDLNNLNLGNNSNKRKKTERGIDIRNQYPDGSIYFKSKNLFHKKANRVPQLSDACSAL